MGRKVTEIVGRESPVRGLYIMGENPIISDPDVAHAEDWFLNLDFLAVQDLFLTESARCADVVLPGASFAEKDGTFVNTERRIQLSRKAIDPPGQARGDLDIVLDAVPARTADLIRRTKVDGASVAEAAAAHGISETAAKVSIHRGLKSLAARFAGGSK